ncbi:hypothetical protein BU23DRAFT_443850 [Bimuria novae-zelandiae CBS 107.79]|uniref:Uncharacterized protein n=1 Tax=Bimuria novae-zelandiae CBS 107.79 TaxID=1447943 RepID=A0A6A5VRG9_9PLEO|nr:hypothetical protein BU23DRAFT_443850 [Bimuria novae-zelandiae CBS 107.79]
MAPLEPSATAQSNRLPFALFAGQTALVAFLTTNVLLKTRQAARTLPPTSMTRAQVDSRRNHAIIFFILAFLSLASVTTFAVVWRAVSYLDWAHIGGHEMPGSIWSGWYGTGEAGVGRWRLGDWLSDTDLIRASDEVGVAKPEAFIYTTQHFVALIANAIFMGVEAGRRHNLSASTIASFVVLSAMGSLGYALNLFFIIMLYTPLVVHSDDTPRHDALFTPKSAVFTVPVWISIFALHTLPGQLRDNKDVILLRWGYVFVPLFLAFAPQIVSERLGNHYPSKAAAHRSYARIFHQLSIAAFLLHAKVFGFAFLANTPLTHTSYYDRLKDRLETAVGRGTSTPNRLLEGLGNLTQKLKPISIHPAVSVTTSDVFFASVALLVWAFIRDLDVGAMLDSSVLSFLASHKQEKHVAFEEQPVEPEELDEFVPVVTPRRRGRPRKGTLTNGALSSSSAAASHSNLNSLKRPTRRGLRSGDFSDPDDVYVPDAAEQRDLNQTETDGEHITDDVVGPAESTALALFLGFVGGLGQMSASVLGAEVTAE